MSNFEKFIPKFVGKLINAENYDLAIEIGFNLFFKISAVLLGLLTNRWLNDNIDSESLSDYFVIISYNAIILQVFSLSTSQVLQKFYTNKELGVSLGTVWTTINVSKLALYFFSIPFIFLTYQAFTGLNQDHFGYLLLIYTGQYILEVDNHYRAISNTNGKAWKFSLTDLISKIIFICLLFLVGFLAYSREYYYFYILVLFSINLISLILDAFLFHKDVMWGKIDFSIFRQIYKNIIYLSIANILLAFYESTDKLFLAYYKYPEDVIIGYSNAYLNLFDKVKIIVFLTIPVLASNMRVRINKDPYKRKNIFLISSGIALGISICLGLGIFFVGPLILGIIDRSNSYPVALEVLPILAIAIVPFTMQIYFGLHLVFASKESNDLISHLATFLIAIPLYFFLIKDYGAYGAAWSTVIIYSATTLFKFSFLYYFNYDEKKNSSF